MSRRFSNSNQPSRANLAIVMILASLAQFALSSNCEAGCGQYVLSHGKPVGLGHSIRTRGGALGLSVVSPGSFHGSVEGIRFHLPDPPVGPTCACKGPQCQSTPEAPMQLPTTPDWLPTKAAISLSLLPLLSPSDEMGLRAMESDVLPLSPEFAPPSPPPRA